jgi:hypothetical protein
MEVGRGKNDDNFFGKLLEFGKKELTHNFYTKKKHFNMFFHN